MDSNTIPTEDFRDIESHVLSCKKEFGDNYTMYVSYTMQWTMANGAKIIPWTYEEYMALDIRS